MRKQQTTNKQRTKQNRRFFALMLATATATISKTEKGKKSQFSSIYELLRM
jgi:hypothetical protein